MLLDYYDARRQLLASLPAVTDSQVLPLTQAVGRVLAADVAASYDTPQFDNSAMDGYAIADPQADRLQFSLVGRIAAGDSAEGVQLQPGQAAPAATRFATPWTVVGDARTLGGGAHSHGGGGGGGAAVPLRVLPTMARSPASCTSHMSKVRP